MASWLTRTLRRLQTGEKYDLSFILGGANPDASWAARVEWLEQLLDWVRYTGGGQSNPSTRLKFLLQLLERNPEWKKKSAQVIRSVLLAASSERLFSETGVPSMITFTREFMSRFIRVLIPNFEDPKSMASLLGRVLYDEDDARWIAEIPESTVLEIVDWLSSASPSRTEFSQKVLSEACDACTILVIKTAAIALREDVAERSPEYRVANHPLLKLEAELAQMSLYAQGIIPGSPEEHERCHFSVTKHLVESRRLIEAVRAHLEEFGVSVDLVYQIERMKRYLERIEILSEIVFSGIDPALADDAERARYRIRARDLLVMFVQGQIHDRDFGYILRKNVAILSRKIVERAGVSGEHYITQTRKEYWHMYWMAAGGGVLTAGTAWVKYAVSTSNWPMFVEILYNSLNYSVSFVIMHFLGFKLATKQPSVTAAALAGQLKDSDDHDDAFVDEVARIARSQFAAVLGNISAVIPTAWLIDRAIWKMSGGNHFLTADKAMYVLETIHPWLSLTVVYAAMTGVLLWFASMTAGWVENAVVFYRVPEIVRTHKVLRRLLGADRTAYLAESLIRNTSGIVGAVSLGVYLAVFPMLGKFFGLPLDVRHVTLTTGTVTYAFGALGLHGGMIQELWLSFVGVALIGTMNFGISFLLAMSIAVRARDVRSRRLWRILRRAAARFRRAPWQFLLPPKRAKESKNESSHA